MKKFVITVFTFFMCYVPFAPDLAYFAPAFASENLQAVNAYNTGIDYFGKGNVDLAIKSFREAIKIDPTFQEAYYNLAQILAAENQINEAISLYKTALTIDEIDYQSMFALAELFYQKKQYNQALSYVKKIPYEDENYQDAQKLKAAIDEKLKQIEMENEKKLKEAQAEKERAINGLLPVFAYKDIKNPSGVTTDLAGNTYIASFSENTVYKYNAQGQKSVFVSPSILNGPLGLCTDSNNNLYVANYSAGNILKVLPNGAPYVFVKIKKPYIISAFGGFLYVTEQETNTVLKYPL